MPPQALTSLQHPWILAADGDAGSLVVQQRKASFSNPDQLQPARAQSVEESRLGSMELCPVDAEPMRYLSHLSLDLGDAIDKGKAMTA